MSRRLDDVRGIQAERRLGHVSSGLGVAKGGRAHVEHASIGTLTARLPCAAIRPRRFRPPAPRSCGGSGAARRSGTSEQRAWLRPVDRRRRTAAEPGVGIVRRPGRCVWRRSSGHDDQRPQRHARASPPHWTQVRMNCVRPPRTLGSSCYFTFTSPAISRANSRVFAEIYGDLRDGHGFRALLPRVMARTSKLNEEVARDAPLPSHARIGIY
jgi:hypothetical protein